MFPFKLGRAVATPVAMDVLNAAGINPATLLDRHSVGDWGTVCDEDAAANEVAVKNGDRVLSKYLIAAIPGTDKGVIVWVMTEGDRSATTILLPDEY